MTSWMREEPTGPSNEDYLLGKKIDKNFEQQGSLGQINAVEYDCTPMSIFASQAEHQVDIQRKLQEDPLIAIKKQEIDTRKKVLDNPIKMRQIKEYIEKNKKKKKSKKRKKKRSRSSSSSSNSSVDSDQDLDKLLLEKLEQFDPNESSRTTEKRSGSSKRDRKSPTKEEKRRHRSRSRSRSRDRDRGHHRRQDRRSRSRSRDRHRHSHRDQRRDHSHRDRERDGKSKKTTKTDDAERERKLREMMDNAKWRDDQRKKNVSHYRKKDEEEEQKFANSVHDPDFITKQLVKASTSGTVEKRIQANRHNIQRGSGAMDQHFAKR